MYFEVRKRFKRESARNEHLWQASSFVHSRKSLAGCPNTCLCSRCERGVGSGAAGLLRAVGLGGALEFTLPKALLCANRSLTAVLCRGLLLTAVGFGQPLSLELDRAREALMAVSHLEKRSISPISTRSFVSVAPLIAAALQVGGQ